MPTTPLSGVRSSWLMVGEKRDFACTAASAATRALENFGESFLSEMSVITEAMPVMVPSSAIKGVLAMITSNVFPLADLDRGLVAQRRMLGEQLVVGLAVITHGHLVRIVVERLADDILRDTPKQVSNAAFTSVTRRSVSRRITGSSRSRAMRAARAAYSRARARVVLPR